MKKYRKFAIISLVAGFGIITGLNLKDLIKSDFVFQDNLIQWINPIAYLALMSVMFYEWIKILKQEKEEITQ